MPRKSTKASHASGGLSYNGVRGILFLLAFSATVLTAVAAMMGLFEKAWFDYTVSQYYFLIVGGVMFLASLFILFEVRGHKSIQKGLKEDFNVWMAGGIINLILGIWAAVIENHRDIEAEFVDNGLPKHVEDYASISQATAGAFNHTFWGVALGINTVYFCAVFLPKYVTPMAMGMCNGSYRASSGEEGSSTIEMT